MSEFWKRKMRTYFRTFDFDGDGVINEDDFAEMGRRFSQAEHADPKKREELIEAFVQLWRKYMKAGDSEKDSRMTVSIFTESIKQQLNDPELINALTTLLRCLFDLMDLNRDGHLDPEEHKRWFDQVGLPAATFDRRRGFDALDTNGDGVITFEELIEGCLDFFFSEDESSQNKYFFGRLDD